MDVQGSSTVFLSRHPHSSECRRRAGRSLPMVSTAEGLPLGLELDIPLGLELDIAAGCDRALRPSAEDLARANWPLKRPPYLLETSCPGIYAVGDVRGGNVKRVASAVGEGSIAVASVRQVLRQ